jgi:general secretion pathway protein K
VIRRQRRQRGFALLIVLWTLGLLALLGSYLVAAARERTVLTGDMREAAVLREAADGATQHAIFALLDNSPSHWEADGAEHIVRIGSAIVTVRLENEADKVNPNYASVADLQAVLQQVSVDSRVAQRLAAAIVAWRTPGAAPPENVPAGSSYGKPFRRLDELGQVPGMTSEILDRLEPRLTLFSGGDPDLTAAASGAGPAGAVRIASIVAVARGRGDAMFATRVVVRTNARRAGSRYESLMYQQLWPGRDMVSTFELSRITP